MALVPFIDNDVELFINQLQTGHGIAIYRASPMQAGDGILSWLPFLSRLGPRLMTAARSVIPAARDVAVDALKGAATAAVTSGAELLQDAVADSSTLQANPALSTAAHDIVRQVEKRTLKSVGEPTYVQRRRFKVTRRTAPTVLD